MCPSLYSFNPHLFFPCADATHSCPRSSSESFRVGSPSSSVGCFFGFCAVAADPHVSLTPRHPREKTLRSASTQATQSFDNIAPSWDAQSPFGTFFENPVLQNVPPFSCVLSIQALSLPFPPHLFLFMLPPPVVSFPQSRFDLVSPPAKFLMD